MANTKVPNGWGRSDVTADRLRAFRARSGFGCSTVTLYSEDQPRDDHGRWGDGGGSDSTSSRAGLGDIPVTDKLLSDFKGGSAEKYLVHNADGTTSFTSERQALHDEIVSKALAGHVPSDSPTFTMLGGGCAAGKSSLVNSGAIDEINKSLVIAPDDVKAQLPEYQQMVADGNPNGAVFTHEESSYISYRIQAAAFESRYDVALDGCGDSGANKIDAKLDAAHAAGYTTQGAYVTVPTDMAVSRSIARGEATGRALPETVVRNSHIAVSQVFPKVMTHFDKVALYDTRTNSPVRVLSGTAGKISVDNQALWDQFVAKGSE